MEIVYKYVKNIQNKFEKIFFIWQFVFTFDRKCAIILLPLLTDDGKRQEEVMTWLRKK